MRALITGGKGFVGQWLAGHLKDRVGSPGTELEFAL